jgi:hypothetical protein
MVLSFVPHSRHRGRDPALYQRMKGMAAVGFHSAAAMKAA